MVPWLAAYVSLGWSFDKPRCFVVIVGELFECFYLSTRFRDIYMIMKATWQGEKGKEKEKEKDMCRRSVVGGVGLVCCSDWCIFRREWCMGTPSSSSWLLLLPLFLLIRPLLCLLPFLHLNQRSHFRSPSSCILHLQLSALLIPTSVSPHLSSHLLHFVPNSKDMMFGK